MTMTNSIYTAMSGLLGYSKGLDVISSNVANLNTPGFKGTELLFRDLFFEASAGDSNDEGGHGVGLDASKTRLSFRAGEVRDTGNSLDAAIDGNGFFVVRRDGEDLYTRAGQFEIDRSGFLVERGSAARVLGYRSGHLEEISIQGRRTSSPRATTSVGISGNLSTGSTTADLADMTVIDAFGGAQVLSLRFTRDSVDPLSWVVEVRDRALSVVGSGTLKFLANGSPAPGFNTFTFSLAPDNTPTTLIELNFGESGSFSGVTNFAGGATSELQVQTSDGFAAGALTDATFDESGLIALSYSNGQTATGEAIALAWFSDLQALAQVGDGMFANRAGERPTLGTAQDGVMGRVVAQRLELSNVELAQQFTDIIVIQRGYQASSQVASVANEMIQQLLDMDGSR